MNVSRPGPGAPAALAALVIAFNALAPLAASAESTSRTSTIVAAAVIPCADAANMMRTGMMPTSTAKTGAAAETDATYVAMAREHAKALMSMVELEMRCGHDAKVKADAEHHAELVQKLLNTLQIF